MPVRMANRTAGGADNVASNVVNAWTNASFVAGQFFNGGDLAVVATGAATLTGDTWRALPQISGAFDGAMNNAIVMIWPEAALAQNATFDVSEAQLEAGAACGPFIARPPAGELALCQRFYERHPGALEGGFAGQSVRVGAKYLNSRRLQHVARPQLVHSRRPGP